MRLFRLGITGDFLNEDGVIAYGDIGLLPLQSAPHVRWHFIADHAPGGHGADYWGRLYSLEVKAEHIAEIDGLVVLRPWVKASAFAQGAANLTVIGRSGAGYDKIDLTACSVNDVVVFNCPGALAHATASSALMFILALVKRLPQQERVAREGRWELQAQVMGSEIYGRTLGIVGLGASGRELARLAAPFHMHMIAYSPNAQAEEAQALGVRLTTLDEVMRESDIVSIHSRLTHDKRKMIGARELSLMKPTAYLVNVARGELIDQRALVDALRERRIAGAGLDVYEREPLPKGDPLLQLDNVIVTPHFSPATSDIWQATGRAITEGMLKATRGEVPDNVVNPDVLDHEGFQRKLARFAENQVQ